MTKKVRKVVMKKDLKISNLDELRSELLLLKAQAREQEAYLSEQYSLLKQKVDGPFRFVNNLISWIPGVDVAKELLGNKAGKGQGDWVSRLFSAGSAAVLNRLFLRRTGFLKRILLTAVTQQTASLVNQDRAVGLIKQIADWIRGNGDPKEKEETVRKKKKVRARVTEVAAEPVVPIAPDFGVPPYSETS